MLVRQEIRASFWDSSVTPLLLSRIDARLTLVLLLAKSLLIAFEASGMHRPLSDLGRGSRVRTPRALDG